MYVCVMHMHVCHVYACMCVCHVHACWYVYEWHNKASKQATKCKLASFPGLLPFLPSVCVHNNTQEWKSSDKRSKAGSKAGSIQMTSSGHKVDVGGRGPTTKTTHWIIRLNTVQQFWTLVSIWLSARPPIIHLASSHMMNAPRPSPFFVDLPPIFRSCVLLWMETKAKTGNTWEQGYK